MSKEGKKAKYSIKFDFGEEIPLEMEFPIAVPSEIPAKTPQPSKMVEESFTPQSPPKYKIGDILVVKDNLSVAQQGSVSAAGTPIGSRGGHRFKEMDVIRIASIQGTAIYVKSESGRVAWITTENDLQKHTTTVGGLQHTAKPKLISPAGRTRDNPLRMAIGETSGVRLKGVDYLLTRISLTEWGSRRNAQAQWDISKMDEPRGGAYRLTYYGDGKIECSCPWGVQQKASGKLCKHAEMIINTLGGG